MTPEFDSDRGLTTQHGSTRTPWYSGLQGRLASIHRACTSSACVRRFRPLRSALVPHAGILLNGKWYCGIPCLRSALCSLLVSPGTVKAKRVPEHRIPLGLLMLSRGELTQDQLRTALEAQRKAVHRRLGEWLCELGYTSESQITVALGVQSSHPVLPQVPHASKQWSKLLPLALQTSFNAFPVHFSVATRVVSVAFAENPDYTLLYTAERMLRCRTQACLIKRSELRSALAEAESLPRDSEVVFDRNDSVQERVQVVYGYAERLSAYEVDVAHCGEYVWVRLHRKYSFFDLLFRNRRELNLSSSAPQQT